MEESPNIPSEANFALKNINSPNFLVNFISSNLNVTVDEKQELLELPTSRKKPIGSYIISTKSCKCLNSKTRSKQGEDRSRPATKRILFTTTNKSNTGGIRSRLPDQEIESLRMRVERKNGMTK